MSPTNSFLFLPHIQRLLVSVNKYSISSLFNNLIDNGFSEQSHQCINDYFELDKLESNVLNNLYNRFREIYMSESEIICQEAFSHVLKANKLNDFIYTLKQKSLQRQGYPNTYHTFKHVYIYDTITFEYLSNFIDFNRYFFIRRYRSIFNTHIKSMSDTAYILIFDSRFNEMLSDSDKSILDIMGRIGNSLNRDGKIHQITMKNFKIYPFLKSELANTTMEKVVTSLTNIMTNCYNSSKPMGEYILETLENPTLINTSSHLRINRYHIFESVFLISMDHLFAFRDKYPLEVDLTLYKFNCMSNKDRYFFEEKIKNEYPEMYLEGILND